MIELRNVTKTYPGNVTAIKDINLTIDDGDIFGIIGLSGAGKSTLVRCINHLEKPTSGEVVIDGKVVSNLNKKDLLRMRENIGMIFQSFCLLEQRTVFDNVKFPLELKKAKDEGHILQKVKGIHVNNKEHIDARVNYLLDLVGLSDKAKSYPSQLSGGQKQRVAIARALANNPQYLLCDEATSALDPDTTDSILRLLLNINKQLGVTIIIISHDMSVIASICNRVAVLDKSSIVEQGTREEVFTHPQSKIAKRFIEYRKLEDVDND